jgi:hypothetical protein
MQLSGAGFIEPPRVQPRFIKTIETCGPNGRRDAARLGVESEERALHLRCTAGGLSLES